MERVSTNPTEGLVTPIEPESIIPWKISMVSSCLSTLIKQLKSIHLQNLHLKKKFTDHMLILFHSMFTRNPFRRIILNAVRTNLTIKKIDLYCQKRQRLILISGVSRDVWMGFQPPPLFKKTKLLEFLNWKKFQNFGYVTDPDDRKNNKNSFLCFFYTKLLVLLYFFKFFEVFFLSHNTITVMNA